MKIKQKTRRKITITILIVLSIILIKKVDVLPQKNKLYKNNNYYKIINVMYQDDRKKENTNKKHVKEDYYNGGVYEHRLKYNQKDEYFILTNDGLESYGVDDLLTIGDLINK